MLLFPWFIVLHTLVNSREMDPIVRDDSSEEVLSLTFRKSSIHSLN